MERILVAGAGHGGLVAGALLAKNGYDVTVIEKKKETELGYDWEDRFSLSLLCEILNCKEEELPADSWRFRGDSVFISPSKRKRVPVHFEEDDRQKIMWRKPLLQLLIQHAKQNGVKFLFETEVYSPLTSGRSVTGLLTENGEMSADLVIDAAGVFSPVRSNLPKYFHIEKMPKYGDVFYAWRAYFNKTSDVSPEEPFEVFLYHEGERGLSWVCTSRDAVDVLIGRIDKLSQKKIGETVGRYRADHPWLGEEIVSGGKDAVIPVRRPLTLMVADGYAAVGDAAFMTTPMNGMGIDLSLNAGRLLAKTILSAETAPFSANALWRYNRDFHKLYGGEAAKNEGLKNSLLKLPSEGVDFLFEKEVIQGADLAGGGKNVQLSALLGKLKRGLSNPTYFFTVVGGLMNGSKVMKLYRSAPDAFDLQKIQRWNKEIEALDITQ